VGTLISVKPGQQWGWPKDEQYVAEHGYLWIVIPRAEDIGEEYVEARSLATNFEHVWAFGEYTVEEPYNG
jgi:hypothetical protein